MSTMFTPDGAPYGARNAAGSGQPAAQFPPLPGQLAQPGAQPAAPVASGGAGGWAPSAGPSPTAVVSPVSPTASRPTASAGVSSSADQSAALEGLVRSGEALSAAQPIRQSHRAQPHAQASQTPSTQQTQQMHRAQPAQRTAQPTQQSQARQQQAPQGRSGATRMGLPGSDRVPTIDLEALLRIVADSGASDLHMTVGAKPMMRSTGALSPIEGFDVLEKEELQETLFQILTQRQREQFEAELELDFSYQVHNGPRLRANFYMQREAIGAAFRVIPAEIKPLEVLGVPPVISTFAGLPRGLVLVTGPTGSGKSTTLAGIIDLANRTRTDHIMSIEDPIEFLHHHKKALVNQREVGADTHSFAKALKHVLRQDPDIILIGELRDQETISTALTAAETGHLVFATLHTQDAAQTIDRIIDVFPSHQQSQVRAQLGGALQAVVCQTLCKRSDGPGRVVATEVMIATPAIRNLIREGKTHQIYSLMQAGRENGMHSMDQHLADLARQGRISYETGLEKCHHNEEFNRLMGRTGGSPGAGFAQHGSGAFGPMEG